VQRGPTRPAPRYWQALAELAGVVPGVPNRPNAPPIRSMSNMGMLRQLKTLGANQFARHFTRFCRTVTHGGV